MAAVANNPSFAKKAGVPQSVGQEFTKADKGRKFAKGGDTMATSKKAMELKHAKAMEKAGLPKKMVAEERKEAMEYKKGGSVFRKAADGIAKKGKTKGTEIVMKAKGGMCK
jgi:hypothetical protein